MKKVSNKHFIFDRTSDLTIKQKIAYTIQFIQSVYYKIRLNLIKVTSEDKKYKVSICTIFKNEAKYLKEWIEFNHIVGVEHFYLYNNNSEDDYLAVLKPYIENGLVTLEQWPKNQAQMECYRECITKYNKETQWIGFIDIDEFIVPKTTNNIYEILKRFERNRGSVKIYWKMFGTSGLIDRDINSLVTKTMTVCWPKYYTVGKCFYNTSFNFEQTSRKNDFLHHMFWAKWGNTNYPPVNVFDKVCMNNINRVGTGDHSVQINHYFTKTFKEYGLKKSKGDVYFKINPHDEEYFYLHEMENTAVDYSAYKYLIKLKLAVKEKN